MARRVAADPNSDGTCGHRDLQAQDLLVAGLTTLAGHPTARADRKTPAANGAQPPRDRAEPARKSGAAVDNISRHRAACSRFAPGRARIGPLIDHPKIIGGHYKPGLSCANPPPSRFDIEVELRGLEPLTL